MTWSVIAIIAVSGGIVSQAKENLNASQSGQRLEARVSDVFRQIGVSVISARMNKKCGVEPSGSPVVFRNARYQSIFGHHARIEFILSMGGKCYLIETKRQNVPGSVDEKLAYVYLNARHNIATHDYILILEGNGWKPRARKWIEDKARSLEGFEVLSFEGFKLWISLHLRELQR